MRIWPMISLLALCLLAGCPKDTSTSTTDTHTPAAGGTQAEPGGADGSSAASGTMTGSINIDGSSTVYPVTEAVAEKFRTRISSRIPTPTCRVRSTMRGESVRSSSCTRPTNTERYGIGVMAARQSNGRPFTNRREPDTNRVSRKNTPWWVPGRMSPVAAHTANEDPSTIVTAAVPTDAAEVSVFQPVTTAPPWSL